MVAVNYQFCYGCRLTISFDLLPSESVIYVGIFVWQVVVERLSCSCDGKQGALAGERASLRQALYRGCLYGQDSQLGLAAVDSVVEAEPEIAGVIPFHQLDITNK